MRSRASSETDASGKFISNWALVVCLRPHSAPRCGAARQPKTQLRSGHQTRLLAWEETKTTDEWMNGIGGQKIWCILIITSMMYESPPSRPLAKIYATISSTQSSPRPHRCRFPCANCSYPSDGAIMPRGRSRHYRAFLVRHDNEPTRRRRSSGSPRVSKLIALMHGDR